MAWKYIVVEVGNREVPVIFPEFMAHSMMHSLMQQYFAVEAAQAAGGLLSESALVDLMEGIQAVSAGEVTFDLGQCTGGSETLGVQSRGREDEALIRRYPYFHGLKEEPDPEPR